MQQLNSEGVNFQGVIFKKHKEIGSHLVNHCDNSQCSFADAAKLTEHLKTVNIYTNISINDL